MSGGPMVSISMKNGIHCWALAGVVYQGPNTSLDSSQSICGLEVIKARRAHFIKPDGTLDIDLWENVNVQ